MTRSRSKVAIKTNMKLWDSLKKQIQKKYPGNWSARKSQQLVSLYKKKGGKFKGPRSKNNSLNKWTKENWRYIDSSKKRYLPDKVIKKLTSKEKKLENKLKGSKKRASYSKSVSKKMKKLKIF